MKSTNKPVIAITMGDPCGIGPEIISKSLNELLHEFNFQPLVLGNFEALEYAQDTINTHIQFMKIDSISRIKKLNDNVVPLIDDSNLENETRSSLLKIGAASLPLSLIHI